MDINLSQVDINRVRGRGVSSDGIQAFAMPSSHTNYPADFAVVSFYADPLSLIERAYVMRRDGWEEPDLSYQRFVKAEKLLDMREYWPADRALHQPSPTSIVGRRPPNFAAAAPVVDKDPPHAPRARVGARIPRRTVKLISAAGR